MQRLVDVLHDPVEHVRVDVLGQGVAGVAGPLAGHVLHVGLRRSHQLPVTQPVLHLLQLHAQQAAEVLQVAVFALGGGGGTDGRGGLGSNVESASFDYMSLIRDQWNMMCDQQRDWLMLLVVRGTV